MHIYCYEPLEQINKLVLVKIEKCHTKKKKKKTFVVFFCSQFSPSQIKTLTNFSMNGFVKLILLKYYKEMQ